MVTRTRWIGLAVAAALLLPSCGMDEETSGPSPVPRSASQEPSAPSTTTAADTGGDVPTGTGAEGTSEAQAGDQSDDGAGEGTFEPTPGIPACDVLDLPATIIDTIDDIEVGGPYEHPRNDGVRFENREGILPDEARDYYREFTVETPGLDHRGARRIVTGGGSETDPDHWFYTGDHYESFCEFAPEQIPSP